MTVKIFKSMLPRAETAQLYDFAKKRPSAPEAVAEANQKSSFVRGDDAATRLRRNVEKVAPRADVRAPGVFRSS